MEAIVTAPPLSVMVTFDPAVKANVSLVERVLPPAVIVLQVFVSVVMYPKPVTNVCIWSAVANPVPPSDIAAVLKTAPVPNPKLDLAVEALAKSERLLAFANFNPMFVLTVVEKEASSPRAAANSFKVFRAAGDESTRPDTSAST